MLISGPDIRRIYPNDIGSAKILKALLQEKKIKVAKREKMVCNTHSLDSFRGVQSMVTFVRAEDVEKVVNKILTENSYRISTETKDGYKRLLNAITKLRELKNDTDTTI